MINRPLIKDFLAPIFKKMEEKEISIKTTSVLPDLLLDTVSVTNQVDAAALKTANQGQAIVFKYMGLSAVDADKIAELLSTNGLDATIERIEPTSEELQLLNITPPVLLPQKLTDKLGQPNLQQILTLSTITIQDKNIQNLHSLLAAQVEKLTAERIAKYQEQSESDENIAAIKVKNLLPDLISQMADLLNNCSLPALTGALDVLCDQLYTISVSELSEIESINSIGNHVPELDLVYDQFDRLYAAHAWLNDNSEAQAFKKQFETYRNLEHKNAKSSLGSLGLFGSLPGVQVIRLPIANTQEVDESPSSSPRRP